MSYLSEHTQEEKLRKAQILVIQVGCIVSFVDLNNLAIDNKRGEDLSLPAAQLRGLLLLLDHAADVLSEVKRLIAENGLVGSTQLSKANHYVDSAQAIFDVSRKLFALHREQQCARYPDVPELSTEALYVSGFFCGLNKVVDLTSDCWTILNAAYNQAVQLEGGAIEQN